VRAWLASPRRRRRLAWTLVPLLAGVGVAGGLTLFGGKARVLEPDLELTGEAQVYRPAPEIELTRAQRAAADRTLHEFVTAAVLRESPDVAWRLAAAELKAGVSRAQWDRGDMPVYPYPARADKLSWRVEKAYADHVELDVLLFPRVGADAGPMSFAVELKPRRAGWAVSYWYPRRALAGGGGETSTTAAPPTPAPAAPARDTSKGRLGHAFFLIPAAILSLIVLAPLTFLLVTWYRGRRAYRRYARRES
jgi:hypothetical protein